ncbi:winged helix-turn-helix domain-containing protein [Streptomyces sp. SID13031]|uniref:ArsR/SmtB family transcription factor n=1 Tax=Streptomyces sp. SID13031 TaxID=2706046 RepID=UPI0013CAC356|nr:winged helix-turn-helix domain-containing protein [Streptomyces sp. SID13031]NEA37264.1 winged helix-turn-helix transcriptional regulator [Streptomyces sp. SID13031]
MSPANRRTADTSVIAAVHHPLRRRLIDLISVEGPSTASRLAEATGELVGNVSHHLKVLAAAGVIEEAPELAKNRRERWWRSAHPSHLWSIADGADDPAAELIAVSDEEARLAHQAAKVRGWFEDRQQYDEPWMRAAFSAESWVTLTPERLAELSGRIQELLQEYSDEPSSGADAETVFVFAHGVPARP